MLIKIDIKANLIALSTRAYGETIYKSIKEQIDRDVKTIIQFPEKIEIVSTSFALGFLSEIYEEFKSGKIQIKSENNKHNAIISDFKDGLKLIESLIQLREERGYNEIIQS